MTVYLAGDHAGFEFKGKLAEYLSGLGYTVEDLGPHTFDPEDDYPDYVTPLAHAVAGNPGSFGILCAKSGQGEAMCANRVRGVRAAVFYGSVPDGALAIPRLAREHNDANVLSIGAGFVSFEEAQEAIQIFLTTPFTNETRHVRRLQKF